MSTPNDWPQVPPPPPIENSSPDTHHVKNTRGAENQAPIFSGENLPAAPDNTGVMQVDTRWSVGVSGNPAGRPKGSRNKLTEIFLNTVVDDFAEHGAETLARLRKCDPAMYIKFIAVLLPKALVLQREAAPVDYAALSQEELIKLLEDTRRRRLIEQAIETVGR